jgi:hypothetical protein
MARASTLTLLSLERYGEIMGLDPIHFCQGFSTLRPLAGDCPNIWYQYDWQDGNKVSREQIAGLIFDAERDIADACGYWPAPKWMYWERHPYTPPQRVDVLGTGLNARGLYKSGYLDRGYVISGGVRATDFLATDTFALVDADEDGYPEWAQFEFTITDEQAADLDICEVQAFFKEFDALDAENCRTDPSSLGADEAWRIRAVHASITGTTVTAYIHKWNLFRPQLQEALAVDVIDADDINSYVDEVMFYRVYNDPSDQVTFGWANEVAGCDTPACAWATQAGCLKVRNTRNALVAVQPSSWDDDNETFTAACWAQAAEPQLIWANYYAGYRPESSLPCDLLDDWWAKTIAWLATSRLDHKLCTCANVAETVDWLRDDVSKVNKERSYQNTPDAVSNPFGSRRGEVWAWNRIKGSGKGGSRRRGRTVRL